MTGLGFVNRGTAVPEACTTVRNALGCCPAIGILPNKPELSINI
jgi:hypothetical protein